MEQNYDENYWKQKCPKVDCRNKKNCCCGLKFVSIPAALSEEVTPENGAYSNAIVRYEDTGEVWVYSAEGVPVLVKEGRDAS